MEINKIKSYFPSGHDDGFNHSLVLSIYCSLCGETVSTCTINDAANQLSYIAKDFYNTGFYSLLRDKYYFNAFRMINWHYVTLINYFGTANNYTIGCVGQIKDGIPNDYDSKTESLLICGKCYHAIEKELKKTDEERDNEH